MRREDTNVLRNHGTAVEQQLDSEPGPDPDPWYPG